MANWYTYNGIGDPTATSSYRLVSVKPTCSGACKICAIYLDETTVVPSSIATTVLAYISNALVTGSSQPGGAAKRFVYLRAC
ncbi:hypothetical protein [Pedobacter steynii]|uniref:Uncharacterized protein n=1 Tax=Pedobacter steynii TaxID=430522 RepID=A0A1D7QBN9_9SPHI|nr:hypothetical protein [Pedobacter steynii]AOM76065.1 hypothetical protein BFS30_02115 [Pedobacter steynii]